MQQTITIMIGLGCLLIGFSTYSVTIDKQVADLSSDQQKQLQKHTGVDQFELGDLAQVIKNTQFRSSAKIVYYNKLKELGVGEKVIITSKKGAWLRVRHKSGLYGWIQADALQAVSNTYTSNWTVMIEQSIAAIRNCQTKLENNRKDSTETRIINIQQDVKQATITLIEETNKSRGYRCTTGSSGGEIYHFEGFNLDHHAQDVTFTSIPRTPRQDQCYSNKLLVDKYLRSLGWLTTYIC